MPKSKVEIGSSGPGVALCAVQSRKLLVRHLPRPPQESRDWMKSQGGGLPKGRVTLVCGSAGCGKSLFAMEFLVHGAIRYGEPGVCMDFEETETKLSANLSSLGFDLRDLTKRKKLLVDFVAVERNQIAGCPLRTG